jgi:hypothetical protein
MKLSISIAIAIACVLWLEGRSMAAKENPGTSPVVVELFTSQGCSSCPSADELVHRLAAEQAVVIPLAFHVDYWNYLGWSDPFSSRSWTQRQMMYVNTFHLRSAYTPQAVVNGGVEMVGSDEGALRARIREESMREAEASVALVANGDRVHVTASSKHPRVDLVLAIVEDGNLTPVARGENSGRSLRNDFVVRTVRRVGTFDKGPIVADVPLQLEASWKSHPLRAVAFAQDRETLRIYGAASTAIR